MMFNCSIKFFGKKKLNMGTNSLETLSNKLRGLWMDIELRDMNPMKHPEDIAIWNIKRAETKCYQILSMVSDDFDQKKWNLLREKPLPNVETAYATMRWEKDQRYVMGSTKKDTEPSNIIFDVNIGYGFSVKTSLNGCDDCRNNEPIHQHTIIHRKRKAISQWRRWPKEHAVQSLWQVSSRQGQMLPIN